MTWMLADAHVHLFATAELPAVAAAARRHFRAQAARGQLAGRLNFCLFLAEMAGQDCFTRLRELALAGEDLCGLALRTGAEAHTLCLGAEEAPLFLFAGRQIVSAEGLEILALGLTEQYPERQPAETVLAELLRKPVVVVLPWGVGKWLGRRGRLLGTLVARFGSQGLFLGDNGNRPCCWPLPGLFAALGQARNLPGTDPLALPGQTERVGSFGFQAQAELDAHRPFQSFREQILGGSLLPMPYGRPQRILPFFQSQLALRRKG